MCTTRTDTVRVTVKEICVDTTGNSNPSIPTILSRSDNPLFVIRNLPNSSQLLIYNIIGQLIYNVKDYQNDFNTQSLGSACYIYRLLYGNGKSIKGKFFVY
jgi:hypothetical protein